MEPLTGSGIVALLVSAAAMWFKEIRKAKALKSNGQDLREIKTNARDAKEAAERAKEAAEKAASKVAIVNSSLEDLKRHCAKTTTQFADQIFELAKEKKG